MGDPFDPPAGDGGALISAAKSMSNVQSDLSSDITKVKGGVALAQEDWTAAREQDFATGAFGIQTQLVLTEDGVRNVAKIMDTYGRALKAATTEIAHLKTQADALKTQIKQASEPPAGPGHRPDIPGGPGDTSGLQYQLGQLESQALGAKTALTKLAGQLAAAVDTQTTKLVPGGASMNPAAIRRAVLYGLDVTDIGPNGTGLNPTRAWAVMSTATWQGQQVLDLVEDNADGEKAGGPSTYLMTDVGELQQLLEAARADGIAPRDYGTLLAQYWAARAAQQAGIDLDAWDPSKGVDGNSATISAVYTFYGKLFLNDPKLQWAGMAAMIGPSFAGGFMDLDMMKDFANDLGKPINDLPGFLKDALPPQLQGLGEISKLSASELGWYEQKFLAMQKHIFFDQGAMHMAYTHGGLGNISEMYQAGLLDSNAMTAWDDIDSGDPTLISQGNELLLSREQNQIIANQYDQMYNHDKPIGPAMTYLMTVVGSASIPGTRTPGEYSPLKFGGSVTMPGPIPFATSETVKGEVTTPLPDFNIANKTSRWNYVVNDTLPAYRTLLAEHPEQARQILETPVDQRIAQQRLLNRIPQLLDQGLTDWGVEVDGDVDAFGVHVGGGVHVGH
jgi:hypothetical protein